MPKPLARLLPVAMALGVGALGGACATSPTGRTQLLFVPPQLAVAEAGHAYRATVRELHATNKLLHDVRLADRVQGVAGRVVATAIAMYPHTADWQWSVLLVDDPQQVNAWCMAGGRMAVYNGLFEQLELTNDELAHIMGHEVAHAVANHQAETMSVAIATQAGLIAAARIADEDDEDMLSAAAVAAQLAITLPNSRTAEAEADRMGIEFAIRAGYDPAAGVSLWHKMEAAAGSSMPQFLSSHPAPANRREALTNFAAQLRHLRPATPPTPYPVAVVPPG